MKNVSPDPKLTRICWPTRVLLMQSKHLRVIILKMYQDISEHTTSRVQMVGIRGFKSFISALRTLPNCGEYWLEGVARTGQNAISTKHIYVNGILISIENNENVNHATIECCSLNRLHKSRMAVSGGKKNLECCREKAHPLRTTKIINYETKDSQNVLIFRNFSMVPS